MNEALYTESGHHVVVVLRKGEGQTDQHSRSRLQEMLSLKKVMGERRDYTQRFF